MHRYTAAHSYLVWPWMYFIKLRERLRPRPSLSSPHQPSSGLRASIGIFLSSVPLCPVALTTDRHLGQGFLGDGTDEGSQPLRSDSAAAAPPVSEESDLDGKYKPEAIYLRQTALSLFWCRPSWELRAVAQGPNRDMAVWQIVDLDLRTWRVEGQWGLRKWSPAEFLQYITWRATSCQITVHIYM